LHFSLFGLASEYVDPDFPPLEQKASRCPHSFLFSMGMRAPPPFSFNLLIWFFHSKPLRRPLPPYDLLLRGPLRGLFLPFFLTRTVLGATSPLAEILGPLSTAARSSFLSSFGAECARTTGTARVPFLFRFLSQPNCTASRFPLYPCYRFRGNDAELFSRFFRFAGCLSPP